MSRTTKVGRNRPKCAAYRAAGTRERNKARRIARDAKRTGKVYRLPTGGWDLGRAA